jgi:methylated-DNA-[protein]-cysteine S-methyltransferase
MQKDFEFVDFNPIGKLRDVDLIFRIVFQNANFHSIHFIRKIETSLNQTYDGKINTHAALPQLTSIIKILKYYCLNGTIDHENIWKELNLEKDFPRLFTRSVMKEACRIKSGEVKTYRDIAYKLKSRAYQAIGNALRRNPFPIIIPCHRIIGSTGIGGFMGVKNDDSWELSIKINLLKFEKEFKN